MLSDEPYSCPDQTETEGLLADRAICPWYYTGTVDYTRVPNFIAQATCKCSEIDGILTREGRDYDSTCHPVEVIMPVLRLKADRAVNSTCLTMEDYELGQQVVRVACVALPNL